MLPRFPSSRPVRTCRPCRSNRPSRSFPQRPCPVVPADPAVCPPVAVVVPPVPVDPPVLTGEPPCPVSPPLLVVPPLPLPPVPKAGSPPRPLLPPLPPGDSAVRRAAQDHRKRKRPWRGRVSSSSPLLCLPPPLLSQKSTEGAGRRVFVTGTQLYRQFSTNETEPFVPPSPIRVDGCSFSVGDVHRRGRGRQPGRPRPPGAENDESGTPAPEPPAASAHAVQPPPVERAGRQPGRSRPSSPLNRRRRARRPFRPRWSRPAWRPRPRPRPLTSSTWGPSRSPAACAASTAGRCG